MKTSDIALAIFVAAISIVVSYFVGGWIFGDPNEKFEKIDFATEISDSVTDPAPEVFNPYANNPTVEVHTGECVSGEVWDVERNTCVAEKTEEEQTEEERTETSGGESAENAAN